MKRTVRDIVHFQVGLVLATVVTYAVVDAESGGDARKSIFCAIAVAIVVAAFVAKSFGLPKRWAFTTYGIEVFALLGAFVIDGFWLPILMYAAGVLALGVVWRFAPVRDAPPAGTFFATTMDDD